MSWFGEWWRRVVMLARKRRFDADLAEELRLHRELRERERRAVGLGPNEARWAAARRFGNEVQIAERSGDMWGWRWLENLGKDLAYGVRLLRLNPGFAAAAILSLALGIGANTAIFQLLNAVRLRTLPIPSPQEIVEVRLPPGTNRTGHFSGWNPQITYPQWELIRAHQQSFSGIFAWAPYGFNLATGGEGRYASGLMVSGGFFDTLGVHALAGRALKESDDQKGCATRAAVISHAFWQREYGGDGAIVGRKVTLDGNAFEIAGVTPHSFFGVETGRRFDVAIALNCEPLFRGDRSRLNERASWWLTVMGRLQPGVTTEQATAQMETVSAGIFEATLPSGYNEQTRKAYMALKLKAFPAGSGSSTLRNRYEDSLWMLLAIAGLVLLIACANLANLMLARAGAREREFAVRLAIGASRGRLVRQLLSESLLLAAFGAALGAFLAGTLSRALVGFIGTAQSAWFLDLTMDWRVLSFTAGVTVLTCVLFGLTPALRATRCAPGAVLKVSGRGLTEGRERFGLRRALVVTQVALSLVLVVSALLFARSFEKLANQDAGFRQDGILIADFDFRKLQLPPERRPAFKRELLERVRAVPGVEVAADAGIVPVSGSSWNEWVWMDGQGPQNRSSVWFNSVSDGYFKTMEVPLLAGRDFDQRDVRGAPRVAIVTESFARVFLGGQNPVGKRFRTEAVLQTPETLFEIIGMVRDVKYRSLRDDMWPLAFAAASQDPAPTPFPFLTVAVRSGAATSTLSGTLKAAVAEVNPEIGLDFTVFKTQIRDRLLQERLMATLSGFFGLLAALLAAIGIYGVISYMVVRRRNEIGIRMALGATRGGVISLILREAVVLLAVGLAVGTLLALAAGQAARTMLYGLQPYDAATMAAALLLLAAVAGAASYWPARRAASLDPLAALREE